MLDGRVDGGNHMSQTIKSVRGAPAAFAATMSADGALTTGLNRDNHLRCPSWAISEHC
jgi:hypothetical protein